MTFIEQDCTIEHEGKKFTAGGAVVADNFITAYLGKDGILTDWHGNQLGTWREVSRWRINSYLSDSMLAVHATVGGKVFKGRSLGVGMSFNGRLSK